MKAKAREESGFLNINTTVSPTPQPPVIQPLFEDNKSKEDNQEPVEPEPEPEPEQKQDEPEKPVEPEVPVDSEGSDYSEYEENREKVFITAQLNTAINSIEGSMERFRKNRYNADQTEAEMGNVLFRSSLQK